MASNKAEPDYIECILASGKKEIINKKNLIGFCHYSEHRGFITRAVLKTHDCESKGCHYLEKFDNHPFWVEKERQKQRKKNCKKANKIAKKKKEQKEERYKKMAQEYVDKSRFRIEITSVRKVPDEDKYVFFYISPNPFDDRAYYSNLERYLVKQIQHIIELRHVKEIDGSYAIMK